MNPGPVRGRVAPELVAEYGAIALWSVTVRVTGRAATQNRTRLGHISNAYRGADVVRVHGRTAAHEGFRTFARQVGIDPDRTPTRADAAAREAVVAGRLASLGPAPDALLAVAVQSGVPVWALDASTIVGDLELRVAGEGERLGRGRARRTSSVAPGTIVVADGRGPVALLLADPPPAHDGSRAAAVVLYTVGVPDVPEWEVSEAVWSAARFLDGT